METRKISNRKAEQAEAPAVEPTGPLHLRCPYYSEPYLGIAANSREALAARVAQLAGVIGPCEIIQHEKVIGYVDRSAQYDSRLELRYCNNRPGQRYLWLAGGGQVDCLR